MEQNDINENKEKENQDEYKDEFIKDIDSNLNSKKSKNSEKKNDIDRESIMIISSGSKKDNDEYEENEFIKNEDELIEKEKLNDSKNKIKEKNELNEEPQILKNENNNNEDNYGKENNEIKPENIIKSVINNDNDKLNKENKDLLSQKNENENITKNINESKIIQEEENNSNKDNIKNNDNKSNNESNEYENEFIDNEEILKDNNNDKNQEKINENNKNIQDNEIKKIESEKKNIKTNESKIQEFQKELENGNENDNYENNVSDFLQKDNAHLGLSNNKFEEKIENKENENKQNENKDNQNKDNQIKDNENNTKENQKVDNKNSKNIYIIKRRSEISSNSELMSETEILRMSMTGSKNKEKQENLKQNNNNNYIKEEDGKNINENNINENEKELEKIKSLEEKGSDMEENDKDNNKIEEEKAISAKGSETIIDSIILNELDMQKNTDLNTFQKKDITKNKNDVPKEKIKIRIKYTTLRDLEKQPYKRIKIDSPRSLQIIQENGYTKEELYYTPLDRFLFNHKEMINMNKSDKKKRYNFYEELRLNKIKKLCELRDKLIKEQNKINENNKTEYIFNKEKSLNDKFKTINLNKYNNNEKDNNLIKRIILENEERIVDNKLERIKNIKNIELANIVEFELDKNLYKMELNRQEEKYNKELKLLNSEEIKNKQKKINKSKNSGDNKPHKPIINKYTTFNQNLVSFQVAKKVKEYDIYQRKLEQKMEKIEIENKIKNEKVQKKKKFEYERTQINLKKSEDIFNRKQNELIKKIQIKGLITRGIKKMINEKNLDKREINMQKYLSKRDYINQLKNIEEFERQKKYNNYIERENKRSKIQNMKNRIYSSHIYRVKDLQKKQLKDIAKIQKILKNGEGEEEENLDILMEEFHDNPKIAEIIRQYQVKKNSIENNYKIKPKLYDSSKLNVYNTENNKSSINNQTSKSLDKKRIFLYSNNYKNKNNLIKKEERRINNTNPNRNYISSGISEIKNDQEEENEEDDSDNEEIIYEHQINEKVRKYKVKIYKNFLKKLKIEKRNENMRNKQLENIKDPILKRNLEIQFSRERTLIDLRLKNESERLHQKAKDYESNLKNNFKQKQERFVNKIKNENIK